MRGQEAIRLLSRVNLLLIRPGFWFQIVSLSTEVLIETDERPAGRPESLERDGQPSGPLLAVLSTSIKFLMRLFSMLREM